MKKAFSLLASKRTLLRSQNEIEEIKLEMIYTSSLFHCNDLGRRDSVKAKIG